VEIRTRNGVRRSPSSRSLDRCSRGTSTSRRVGCREHFERRRRDRAPRMEPRRHHRRYIPSRRGRSTSVAEAQARRYSTGGSSNRGGQRKASTDNTVPDRERAGILRRAKKRGLPPHFEKRQKTRTAPAFGEEPFGEEPKSRRAEEPKSRRAEKSRRKLKVIRTSGDSNSQRHRAVNSLERDTGFEPATFSLGKSGDDE
jgi:hypothetical protein